ncbi:MAG: hypothetical protein RMJ39_09590 [Deltaproteobacteria bacterium]|nr:hypothetical protein [Deltaproteobacteria bacterium]
MIYEPYDTTLIPSVHEPVEKLKISGEFEMRRSVIRRKRRKNLKESQEASEDQKALKESRHPDSTIEITI